MRRDRVDSGGTSQRRTLRRNGMPHVTSARSNSRSPRPPGESLELDPVERPRRRICHATTKKCCSASATFLSTKRCRDVAESFANRSALIGDRDREDLADRAVSRRRCRRQERNEDREHVRRHPPAFQSVWSFVTVASCGWSRRRRAAADGYDERRRASSAGTEVGRARPPQDVGDQVLLRPAQETLPIRRIGQNVTSRRDGSSAVLPSVLAARTAASSPAVSTVTRAEMPSAP